jgi:hypothetical protein
VAILQQKRNRAALALDREDMVVVVVVSKEVGGGGGGGGEGQCEGCRRICRLAACRCLVQTVKFEKSLKSLMTLFQSMDYWHFTAVPVDVFITKSGIV